MNVNIFSLFKLIIASIPIFLMILWNMNNNLHKLDRSKQFLMPVIALIYVIVVTILIEKLLGLSVKIVDLLTGWLMSLGVFIPFFKRLAQALSDALKDLPMQTCTVSFCIAAISMFMIIKRILISIFKAVFKPGKGIYDRVSLTFFELDNGVYYVKESTVQARNLLRVFYWSAVVISFIMLYLTMALFKEDLLQMPFFPILGILIIGELYFYIDGVTKKEALNTVVGEKENAWNIYNYRAIRKVLTGLFGDKLASDDTTVNQEILNPVSPTEQIEKYIVDDSRVIETYGKFMDRYRLSGHEIDQNYLASGLELLKGNSILFNNPFYYDLIPYIFYAMNHKLLQHKKTLIILGRHGIENDILKWCETGLRNISNVEGLWRIGQLTDKNQDLDVGIISRSDVLNLSLHKENTDFFVNTEYVIIIEPSKLVTTAQIGLNSIIRYCKQDAEKHIVFCSVDKNCDGLVDALSHMLLTSLNEVSATESHEGACSYMCWTTDNDYWQHRMLPNISRYLGVGTELSFVALKNQVSKTYWYGGEKFPVTDMHWIAKQYYGELLSYANLPLSQDLLDNVFNTSANMWNARKTRTAYITVEDEANNVFEMKREFATRSKEQTFVNIISSPYLLCDYMTDNKGIFNADSKAIPYIVADYVTTRRNVLLRLCIQMTAGYVWEDVLSREIMLSGMKGENLVLTFWENLCKCYKPINDESDKPVITLERAGRKYEFTSNVIIKTKRYNVQSGVDETCYHITDDDFIHIVLGDLSCARYIAEDEAENAYVGTESLGHIFQKYLPGQFFTLCGKYYEMLNVTYDGRIRIRRAADHITGRHSYRQERKYTIHFAQNDPDMGSSKQFNHMKIERQYADISVETSAYWDMPSYNDFVNAQRVVINGIPQRDYCNKWILKLTFSDDEAFTEKIRHTLTNLFNEVFKTLFAENQDLIVAATGGEIHEPLTYNITGEYDGFDENAIYFIEDSQYDIGLITAVERNINRILRIITDYLQWNQESIEASTKEPSGEAPVYTLTEEELKADEKKVSEEAAAKEKEKKSIFKRIAEWFRKLFKKKEKPVNEADTSEEDKQAEDKPDEGDEDTEDTDTETVDGEASEPEKSVEEPETEETVEESEKEESEKEETEEEPEEKSEEPEEKSEESEDKEVKEND